MSDGPSDASRADRKAAKVEIAAMDLADALLATGDLAFFRVHPQAVEYANEELARCGFRLVKVTHE